jgi:hypothetical protein
MPVMTSGRDDGLGVTDAAGVAPMKKSLVKNPLFARYFNRFAARREERGTAYGPSPLVESAALLAGSSPAITRTY